MKIEECGVVENEKISKRFGKFKCHLRTIGY